jgi:hypothetical protein
MQHVLQAENAKAAALAAGEVRFFHFSIEVAYAVYKFLLPQAAATSVVSRW